MALVAAAAFDAAHHHPDAEARKQNQAFYEFMVPLVKGYSTEMSIEVASLGVQVHGGMGFIEETGAAQYLRDARILTIYEGTTAIQANDLVGRKTARDGGRVGARRSRRRSPRPRPSSPSEHERRRALDAEAPAAPRARRSSRSSTSSPRRRKANPNAVFAGSVPYLMLGRQRGGRLADGARAARRRGAARGAAKATRRSCAPRSPPRASTPSTC